jgi:hypothetical protein
MAGYGALGDGAAVEIAGLVDEMQGIIARLDSDQSMALTTLEVIVFTATRPTDLDKNAYFAQPICHMQQF